ncbi:MAG: membrane protein insertion efficiency factor YidD [Nitrospinaceae bacterium]
MLNRILIKMIRFYQWFLSPFMVPGCRFYPSCSEYSLQALGRFNLFKALGLTVLRLLKCHPYHPGGCDPLK